MIAMNVVRKYGGRMKHDGEFFLASFVVRVGLPVHVLLFLSAFQAASAFSSAMSSRSCPTTSLLPVRSTWPYSRNAYQHRTKSQIVMMSSLERPLRSITLPILDATLSSSSSSLQSQVIVPLPSKHLPDELTTLNLYGFEVTAPVHKLLIDESIKTAGTYTAEQGDVPQVRPGSYGHLVSRGPNDDLVGSVGCAVDVIMAAPIASPGLNIEKEIDGMIESATSGKSDFSAKDREDGSDESLAVLVRGSFRFVVTEVIKTIPYIVAVVDELRDGEPGSGADADADAAAGAGACADADAETTEDTVAGTNSAEADADLKSEVESPKIIEYNDFGDFEEFGGEDDSEAKDSVELEEEAEEENDEDEDECMYNDLPTQELVKRSLGAMQAIVDQKLTATESAGMSLLEKSILEDAGMAVPNQDSKRSQAEEYGAVLDIFRTELIDICPRPVDVYYAVGLLTAEMADVDNETRAKCLTMTDGIERLRMILKQAESKVSKVAAQRITEQITEDASSDERDLKVGKTELPRWAYQIKKGTRVSYFWNEQEGWCDGTVSEDPTMIVDELIISVAFDDDGSIHKLPFLAEEKVRWRPGDMKG